MNAVIEVADLGLALPRGYVGWDRYTYAELRSSLLYSVLFPIYLMAVFTTAGKGWYVDKAQSVAPNSNALQEWVSWGTGTNAENVTDTALQTEDSGGSPAYARIQGTLSQPAADTDRLVATITSNGTKNITESGRHQQVTGGVLQQRAVFTAIPMVLNDRIEMTHDLQAT